MDGTRFDQLARGLSGRLTRRQGAGALAVLLGIGVAQTPVATEAATDRTRCSPPRNTWCKDHCVNIHNNERHCGKCFHRCAKGEKCKRGTCRAKSGKQCTGPGDACSVFVTSGTTNGAFGGVAGADEICQAAASSGGLSGTYRAWISVGDNNPASRFDPDSGPYLLIDGTVIADDFAELTSSTLQNAISISEQTTPVSGGVWTNSDGSGEPGKPGTSDETCRGFTSTAAGTESIIGFANAADSTWTYGSVSNCSAALHLYCFEQPS